MRLDDFSCERMASSSSCNCSVKKRRLVSSESGILSKPECVTMTASQFPVAMRLKSFLRFCASKSSFPATRMLAAG